MNYKFRIFALLVFALWFTAFSAQTTIKGKVFTPEYSLGQSLSPGAGQGEEQYIPLQGATVVWAGTRLGTMTDIHGFFKLPAMKEGDTLQVSMVGYETVGLLYSGQKYVEIPLKVGVDIEAAEVEGRRSTTNISLLDPLNVQQLNRKELAKAACCKLSMAFETNASVDASFTDAVTGTRQIRMLGLDGKYTQILVDNLPGPRGLNVVQGLSLIPGPWINGISISKGMGSVINGYESITGQINVGMRNPENAEPLHVNLYASGDGRAEWNHVSRHQISRQWSSTFLIHTEGAKRLNDRNGDTFLDTPLKEDLVARSEWKFNGDRGIRGEYSITGVQMTQMAGQKGLFENTNNPFDVYEELLSNGSDSPWAAAIRLDRIEASAKTGYVNPSKEWQSIGTQFFVSKHDHEHRFGNREYRGTEDFFRGNILFSSIISNTNNKFTTGVSYLYDDFEEVGTWSAEYNDNNAPLDTMARIEKVPGAFFEYTWTPGERLVAVAGLRGDFHNLYGNYTSPRLHIRYSLREETTIKLVAGRGFRTANVFMEQLGSWASNRRWWILDDQLQPEVATNFGLNLVSKFKLNSRDATLSVDGYHTNFENRIVADLYHSPDEIVIYNLTNPNAGNMSHSTTLQAELDWSAHRRLDIRTAYRWVKAETSFLFDEQVRNDPFVARHRAFTQWSYASKPKSEGQQFRIDGVLQWVGSQNLPLLDGDYPFHPEETPSFTQVNLQLTKTFKDQFELYFGMENIMNVVHENPIVGAVNSIEGPEVDLSVFDASIVYGPIFGRMSYAGLRWTPGS